MRNFNDSRYYHLKPKELARETIIRFLQESFETFPTELGELDLVSWPVKLSTYADCFCVQREDGSLSSALFAYLNDNTTYIGYIPLICVLPECEKGTGYRLHELYRQTAVSLGMTRLHLEVITTNIRALNFYTRQGYVIAEECSDRNRYLMECTLLDNRHL